MGTMQISPHFPDYSKRKEVKTMTQYTITIQITYNIEAQTKDEARKQAVLQLPEKLTFAKLEIVKLEGGE
jgi:hypothetical protein